MSGPDVVGALRDESQFNHDFSSPQGAILKLEDAFAASDVEAAVAAKDFAGDAKLMLANKAPAVRNDLQVLDKATEVLELAYRAEVKKKGFPIVAGLRRKFSDPVPYGPGVVLVTEHIQHPDGATSSQRILVSETARGWRVLHPID